MNIPEKFLREWDYTKNWESGGLLPEYTPLNIPVWWKCATNKKYMWRTSVENRIKGVGCPHCAKILSTRVSILTRHPELMKEWDHTRNTISIHEVTRGYSEKVHWICKSEARTCDCHMWEDTIMNRIKHPRCPYCTKRRSCIHSSIAHTHPDLLQTWDYTRNIASPEVVKANGNQQYWWKCSEGHSWQGTIKSRLATKDCLYCSKGLTIDKTHPGLLEEWGDNGALKPNMFFAKESTRVQWVCKNNVCGCHVWSASIKDRAVLGHGCPYCTKRGSKKICIHGSLQYTHPELMKEWDPRNTVLPTEVSPGSDKIVSWVCKSENGACGCHVWKATVNTRVRGSKCPYCLGRKTCVHFSLWTLYPELMKEWDANNTINPNEIGKGCNIIVSWVCKNYPEHKWKAKVCSRTFNNSGCPFCRDGQTTYHHDKTTPASRT